MEFLEEIIQNLKIKDPVIVEPTPIKKISRYRAVSKYSPEERKEKVRAIDRARYSTVKGLWRQQKKWLKQRKREYEAKGNTLRAEGCEFLISLEDWTALWKEAGSVWYHGRWTAAHVARGTRYQTDVQLVRIDDTKPWELSNLKIVYQGRCLADGRRVCAAITDGDK